jgi:Lipocalin-like domain
MIKHSFLLFAVVLLFITACKPSVSVTTLTGKWKYVKIEHPNASPPDTMKKADLDEAAPYIQFTPEMKFLIVWGGKFLAHGTFTLNGGNMNMTEKLEDGKTRSYVFTVSELTENKIIFETIGVDGSKVTALRASKF